MAVFYFIKNIERYRFLKQYNSKYCYYVIKNEQKV